MIILISSFLYPVLCILLKLLVIINIFCHHFGYFVVGQASADEIFVGEMIVWEIFVF